MKLTFDYYHNLEQVELHLCNPDGRELFILPGKNRNLTLRFNDLSELVFEVDSTVTLSDGTVANLEAYDYIQTKRLVYATNIGWFQISSVDEQDNGVVKYKSITAESYQATLKNKGFFSEERVYCFYNPDDPYDDRYDASQEDAIPSVMGQLKKQLGINQALRIGISEPSEPFDDWTITYVSPDLIYSDASKPCRTFKENTTFGYDWIVNDVEDAFGVIVLFDIMYKTIHVMTPQEITTKANVIYTFNNFMKNINVVENADDIVTVLNCNGDNCDIRGVNPTGTNYICDFSYYMDEVNNRWMSPALITKLKQWSAACESRKGQYEKHIADIRELYKEASEKEALLQEMSVFLADLKAAQNKRMAFGNGTPGGLCGIVSAERVKSYRKNVNGTEVTISGKSIKNGTKYYSTPFTGAQVVTAYQFAPKFNSGLNTWVWNEAGYAMTGTADEIIAHNLSDDNVSGVSYWYFSDVTDGSSYCKLESAVTVDKETTTSVNYCGGFTRYIAYTYPLIHAVTGNAVYTDGLQEWVDLRERHVTSLNVALCGYVLQLNGYQTDSAGEVLNPTSDSIYGRIKTVQAQIDAIVNEVNILSYFSQTPDLFRELSCYWIEGDYTNDHIAVLDETTPAEEIDLSNELLESGRIELSKVCQPRYSFSIESINVINQYEFREQMRELELGKIVTIEKEEGVWYYPALLEISMSLDNSDEFAMSFANAMRLDDWGYTYADLISDAASTSRQVSANWQDILAYAKERDRVTSLIKDPLNATLRAGFANMVNQEFTIDKSGILGRKRISETSDDFEKEQVRLINNLLIFTDDNWETARTALGKIYYTDENGDPAISYGLIAETIIGSLIMGNKLHIVNNDNTIQIDANGIAIVDKKTGEKIFHADTDGSLVIKNYVTADDMNDLGNTIRQEFKTANGELISDISKKYATQSSVNSDINFLSTLIAQNENSIKLKASQSSVDSLGGRMDSAEASIEVQAGQIALKASQTSVDGLSTRLSTAESAITQNATNISAKVSQSYGDSSSMFGWSLKPSGFYIYSDSSTVMTVTSSGLSITGTITAIKGEIAGFVISGNTLSKEVTEVLSEEYGFANRDYILLDNSRNKIQIVNETLEYSEVTLHRSTTISSSGITIELRGRELPVAQRSFMTIVVQGTPYKLYVDTDTMTVKAM